MKLASILLSTLTLTLALPSPWARAQESRTPPVDEPELRVGAWENYRRPVAFEVNVLWPFFPGGITDLRVMVPLLHPGRGNWRGELVTGLHSDFAWRFVREPDAGRVAFLGAKLGWRQFLVYGLHVEAQVNLGWRHEEDNPWDGEPIDSFQGRLWTWVGYQHELTRNFYANLRGGVGVHLFRTDRFADRERTITGGADLNLGFRF